MPYLMLMELCQVQGESRGFAELSLRYEAAFRRPSPSWQVSIGRGKPLDACLSVMAHLQVVWADLPAALRMLTELVVRGSGPGESGFDLPAFKDLLTLFSVARPRAVGRNRARRGRGRLTRLTSRSRSPRRSWRAR